MTELEAAEKLASLLNEIQAAGHPVATYDDMITVGDHHRLNEPVFDEQPWAVEA